MQIIVQVRVTVREYCERATYRMIRPEQPCPQCGKSHPFELLGYYQRWVTDENGEPVRIPVRRFTSRFCAGTISCLPAFCQPYRVLNNSIIETFMWTSDRQDGAARWSGLLGAYRRRFQWWCDCLHDPRMGAGLRASTGSLFSRPPPGEQEAPAQFWARVLASCGNSLNNATGRLVEQFNITLFGRYLCHQPRERPGALEAG